MSEPDRRAVAQIDVGAIERNCARLAGALSGDAELCAVVKADGYGHGALTSARAALAGGATRLAVATAAEAAELRAALPDAALLTMGALTESELEQALGADSDLAVWHPGFLETVGAAGARLGKRPRVHVKADTGMGRLGERDPDEVIALVRAAADDGRLELAGVWTHFATADELEGPGSDFFERQLERFRRLGERIRSEHPGVLLHAANSAATLREPAAHLDLVRCGVAIYGLDPFGRDPAEQGLEPALALRSYLAAVKRFSAGDTAGYGRRWTAERETTVGVVPVGYGDGVRRALSNNAELLVGGRRVPLVGTVSMDNVTVDLGPGSDAVAGSEAVLIGPQGSERILCEELARRIGTINYEVTCAISARVPREPLR